MDFISLAEFLSGTGKFLAKLTNIEKLYFLNFILKFLEQNNFKQTAKKFMHECELLGYDLNNFKQYTSTSVESAIISPSNNETTNTLKSTSSADDQPWIENRTKRNISFNRHKSINPTNQPNSSTTETEDISKEAHTRDTQTNIINHCKSSNSIPREYLLNGEGKFVYPSKVEKQTKDNALYVKELTASDESDNPTEDHDNFSADSSMKTTNPINNSFPTKHKNVSIENEHGNDDTSSFNETRVRASIVTKATNPFLPNCQCIEQAELMPDETEAAALTIVNAQPFIDVHPKASVHDIHYTEEYVNLKKKFLKLQESYNKLRGITKKLSQGIEENLTSSSENIESCLRETLREFSENFPDLIITNAIDSDEILAQAQKACQRSEYSNQTSDSSEVHGDENSIHCNCLIAKKIIPSGYVHTSDRSSSTYPSWLTIMKSQNQFLYPQSSLYETDPKTTLPLTEKLPSDESSDLPLPLMNRIKIYDSGPQKLGKRESSVTFDINSLQSRAKKSIMKSSDSNSSSMASNGVPGATIHPVVQQNVLDKAVISDEPMKEMALAKKLPAKPISKKLMKKRNNQEQKKMSKIELMHLPRVSSPYPEFITEKNYFPLDFPKIMHDLKVGPTYLKLRLIQALRWRLTHASLEMRDKIIRQYVTNDIFGLMDSLTNVQKTSSVFLSSFYFPRAHRTPHSIQQNIARFLNAVASLKLGRDYLTSDVTILQNILLRIVMLPARCGFNFDTVSEEMVVATLQKFSLRNSQRLCMISEGLVEHLVKTLSEKAKYYSMYRLEYATALLMNLCLHKEAQNRCALIVPTVIELIIQLLDSKYAPCLLYVNGAIYSLFMNPNIFNYAKQAGIANLIKTRSKQCDGEVQQQLKFLYKFMTDPQFAKTKCVCEPSNSQDDEIDLIEPEIELFDNLSNLYGNEVLVGERLLRDRYYNSYVPSVETISDVKEYEEDNNNVKNLAMGSKRLLDKTTSTGNLLNSKTISMQFDLTENNTFTDNINPQTVEVYPCLPDDEESQNEINEPLEQTDSDVVEEIKFDEYHPVHRVQNQNLIEYTVPSSTFTDESHPQIDQEMQTEISYSSTHQCTQTECEYFEKNVSLADSLHVIALKPEKKLGEDESIVIGFNNIEHIVNKAVVDDDSEVRDMQNEEQIESQDVVSCACVSDEVSDLSKNENVTENAVVEAAEIENTKKVSESPKLKRIMKKHTKLKQMPSIDLNNVSYNEQTKQFYKKPTKTTIFERKNPPPFTSTKPKPSTSMPASFSRTGPSLDSPKSNTFNVQTCQVYPDISRRPYYIQSSIYNPPYALDYYTSDRMYKSVDENNRTKMEENVCSCQCNRNHGENITTKPSKSETRLLTECINNSTKPIFLPKLHKERIFRSESETKLSMNDMKKPYTHFSKNSTGNYSILHIVNAKGTKLNRGTFSANNRNVAQSTTLGSRRNSGTVQKNPFKSRPKLPRTPPEDPF